MNYILIANETLHITVEKSYVVEGDKIVFPAGDYESVVVISPKTAQELLDWDLFQNSAGEQAKIEVVNEDSYQAARTLDNPLVMNFANAHNPGGGFLFGATAQEEALCRCSTLYASIHSKEAAEMYRYNNTHPHPVESDYMLLSPEVLVFRDEKCVPLKEPFRVGVITIPAPNRHGAALFASEKLIQETMERRIRIMLRVAAKNGYRDLVLGAWGCGAFGNQPDEVASYFRRILIDEGYGKCFRTVRFAIYGKENGRNITAFRNCFSAGKGGE